MPRFQIRVLKMALTAVFVCCIATPHLLAQARKHVEKKGTVTKVVSIAKPKVYNGPCPAEIQFVGTIFVRNPPVTVEYEWIRSDGAVGQRQTIEIRNAGQGVYDTWTLGTRKQRMRVWEKVHVISPVNRTSGPAVATINCK